MTCDETRTRLGACSGAPSAGGSLAGHLATCTACAAYADRLRLAQGALADHHAVVEPPADFAAKVVGALPARGDPIAWAALRMLPAAVALTLVLAGWVLVQARSTPAASGTQGMGDDLLAWVLQEPEEAP